MTISAKLGNVNNYCHDSVPHTSIMQEPGPSARYYNSFAQTAHGPVRPPSPRDDPIFGGEPDPAEFLDGQASDSLYAILNVDRTATTSEIKDKYRSLASTFHPDKQVDDARRQAAHTRFQAIQRAHEVLSDETMRTVYDLFGEEGLRTSWEVGPRVMSAKDLRSHFWSQDEMKRRMEAAALVDSKVGSQQQRRGMQSWLGCRLCDSPIHSRPS